MDNPTPTTTTLIVAGEYINYNNVLSMRANDTDDAIIFTMVGNVILTITKKDATKSLKNLFGYNPTQTLSMPYAQIV